MKKLKNIFIAALALFVLAACRPTASPDEVAVRLHNALTSGDMSYVKERIYFPDPIDYEVFCKYLDMAAASAQYKERTAGYEADYKALSTDINGDEAFVKLQGVSALNEKMLITVRLVLVDGMWKVDGNHGVLHSTEHR